MSWSDRKQAESMTTTSFFKRQHTISRGVWGDMSSRRALGYLARSLVEVLEDDEQREAQHQMNQQLMMQMLQAAQGHAACGAGGCRPPMRPMLPGPGMPGPGMLMPPPSAGGLTMTMQQVHVAPAEGLRPVAMAMPHHGPPTMPCPSGHPPHGHAPAGHPMPSQCRPPHHHVPAPMVSPPSHVAMEPAAAHGVSTPGDTASTDTVTVACSPHGHLRPRTPPRRPPAPPAADGDDEMEEVPVEPEPTLPGAKRLPLRSDPGAAADFEAESERRRAAKGKPASSRPTGPATAEASDSSNDDDDDDDDAGPPPRPAPGRVTSVNRYSAAPAWSKAAAPASRPKAAAPGSASSMEPSAAAGPLEDPRRRREEPGDNKRSRSDLLQWACFFDLFGRGFNKIACGGIIPEQVRPPSLPPTPSWDKGCQASPQ